MNKNQDSSLAEPFVVGDQKVCPGVVLNFEFIKCKLFGTPTTAEKNVASNNNFNFIIFNLKLF